MSELWATHFSFSQLTSVQECPYEYYLLKLAGVKPVENAFAQAGNLCHQILAEWAKGEIPLQELPVQWIERFQREVTADFPYYLAAKDYRGKLFAAILAYFETFDGFSDYEVIGSEQRFISMIAGERFEGIIDLILRHKTTGEITIVDFKSCSLSSFRRNKDQMYRQLLLYSKYCIDEFGLPPAKLRFEFVKENAFDEREYDPEDYVAARIWAESIIEEMKSKDVTDWFETRPEFFRCVNICGCRNECIFGKPENHKREHCSVSGASR